jgi:hypothetical protein
MTKDLTASLNNVVAEEKDMPLEAFPDTNMPKANPQAVIGDKVPEEKPVVTPTPAPGEQIRPNIPT